MTTREQVETAGLPERAKAVAEIADRDSAKADEQGYLTEDVVEALHREGLYGMWVPEVLGGAELDPVPSVEVLENVSYGDPSAGWVLMASALAIGSAGSYLADDAVEEMFGGERMPVIAGQGTRPGNAVPQNGGYLLTGSWSFASGLRHGTHIHTLGVVETTGEPRIFVVPVENAKLLLDSWDVLGLRATGSIDYEIESKYVPAGYSHPALADTGLRGGSLYNLGIFGFVCICHSGWALGIGRRTLDELVSMVHSKAGRPGAQAESEAFLEAYGKAEARYRSARAFVYETWADVTETLDAGDRLSVRQHTLIRLAMVNATWASHEAVMDAYRLSGTTGLRSGRMQQLFRDMHAGTQHITAAPPVYRNSAKELGGLVKDGSWVFLDVVPPAANE